MSTFDVDENKVVEESIDYCKRLIQYAKLVQNDFHKGDLLEQLGTPDQSLSKIEEFLSSKLPRVQLAQIRRSQSLQTYCKAAWDVLLSGCKRSILDEIVLVVAESVASEYICGVGGECFNLSERLVQELKELNIQAKKKGGYFTIDTPLHSAGRNVFDGDLHSPYHYWVEVNNKILDATYVQFMDEIDEDSLKEEHNSVRVSCYWYKKHKKIHDLNIIFDISDKLPRYNEAIVTRLSDYYVDSDDEVHWVHSGEYDDDEEANSEASDSD